MLETDPVSIDFSIPARDHLGREAVVGKVRFLRTQVELSWRLEGNVFTGGKGELSLIELPYGEVEQVELRKKWFRPPILVMRIDNPALVAEIPGVEMGRMELVIDERSRGEVEKLKGLIDFKRSIFLLDEQTRHLRALSGEDA